MGAGAYVWLLAEVLVDAASLEAMDAPRTFHYVFAHRTLPMLAAQDAATLTEALRRDGKALLRLHWKVTCRSLGIEPQPHDAIGYGPGCDQMGLVGLAYLGERSVAGYTVAIVQLPLALQVREAHFVAVAIRSGRARPAAGPDAPPVRYVVWERTLGGGARLAEWALTPQGPRGRRIGPAQEEAGVDDFVAALDRWLRAPPPPREVPPRLVPAAPAPAASAAVTRADGALVAGLLLAWTLMIIVLTLL